MKRGRDLHRVGVAIAIVGLACLAAVGSGAEIYRYVDEHGRTHLTGSSDAIPSRYRAQAVEISGEVSRNDSVNVIPEMHRRPPGEEDAPVASFEPTRATRTLEPEPGAAPAPQSLLPEQLEKIRGLGPAIFGVFALLGVVGLALSGLILCLTCRLMGEEVPSLGRAMLVLIAQTFANLGMGLVGGFVAVLLGGVASVQTASSGLLSIAMSLAVSAKVAGSMLDLSFTRGLVVILVHGVLCVVVFVIPAIVIAVLAGALSLPTG